MRKFRKDTMPREGESLEALLLRIKASPDSYNHEDLAKAQTVFETRLSLILMECGNNETFKALAKSAMRKHVANEPLNELERKMIVMISAKKVLDEINKGNLPS